MLPQPEGAPSTCAVGVISVVEHGAPGLDPAFLIGSGENQGPAGGAGHVVGRAGVLGMANGLAITCSNPALKRCELTAQSHVVHQTAALRQHHRQDRQIVLAGRALASGELDPVRASAGGAGFAAAITCWASIAAD